MGGCLQGRFLKEGSLRRAALKFESVSLTLPAERCYWHPCLQVMHRHEQYVAHRKSVTEKLTVFPFVTIVMIDCSVSGFVPPGTA